MLRLRESLVKFKEENINILYKTPIKNSFIKNYYLDYLAKKSLKEWKGKHWIFLKINQNFSKNPR